MTKPQHRSEADKLWVAIKRDYFLAAETIGGLRGEEDDRRWKRLLKNWRALRSVDIDFAMQLSHGLREISTVFDADHRGPADSHLQQLDETQRDVDDDLDRAANAEVEKDYDLAEAALQRRIDEDPAHL